MKINYKKKIEDESKFRYTNPIWNNLRLNQISKVGMVSQLIQNRSFSSMDEWANYYFETGKLRLEKVASGVKPAVYGANFGRTREELESIGKELYNGVLEKGNPLKITLEECIDTVAYRVIGETYNGIILREENTIRTILRIFDRLFPGVHGLAFRKTSGDSDAKYAVDYEVFSKRGELIMGLQIKPTSYRKENVSIMGNIHEINTDKNRVYEKEKDVPVLYVYSDTKGNLDNQREVIDGILAASRRNKMKSMKISG